MAAAPFLSVITPAYNEGLNLPAFHAALVETCTRMNWTWEWIAIDDHSSDDTFEVMARISAGDPRVRGVRLSRNSGSHLALMCGLEYARGRVVAMMASDMQNPLTSLPAMIAEWEKGTHVVWATRQTRRGENLVNLFFARLYYLVVRQFEGLEAMPPLGADFLVMDQRVARALALHKERSISLFLLVISMGFRQSYVVYERQARLHGRSGWDLGKKIRLISNSIIPFSSAPLQAITLSGLLLLLGALLLAACCGAECWMGSCRNWQVLPALILAVGGAQLAGLGVIGQVCWRVLDEARERPRYLVEADTATPGDPGAAPGR